MAQVSALFDSRSSRETVRDVRLRVSTWHYDTIIDYLLANPGATYGEVAAHINRGQVWVSMVMRSDAFQSHYASRRVVINEAVRDAVTDKIADVAMTAADLTLKHMRDNPQGIGFAQKMETLTSAAKALGFGLAPPQSAVNVNVGPQTTVMLASREQIDRARERLRSLQAEAAASAPSHTVLEARRTVPSERRDSPSDLPGEQARYADSRPSAAPTAADPPAFEFEEAIVVGSDQ